MFFCAYQTTIDCLVTRSEWLTSQEEEVEVKINLPYFSEFLVIDSCLN